MAGISDASGGGFGGFGDWLSKNPATVLGAGVLGADLLFGNKALPAEASIQQSAGEAASHARTLEAYQQSGTLPPGLQSIVDQHTNAAEAALRSSYAKSGLSGSTMEAQQIGQIKMAAAGQTAALADGLAKQGIAWSELSGQELGTILRAQQLQDSAFTQAMMSFARGLAGGVFTGSGTTNNTTTAA